MPEYRHYTAGDMDKLPGFLRIDLIDGEIYTDDWTALEIDESVFRNKPSEGQRVTYRLSVVKVEKASPDSLLKE